MAHEPLKIFVSYSHVDFEWQRKITSELELLGIDVWEDRQIKPGDRWQTEIEQALAGADIILLLISRDFLTSDFVTTEELPAALRRVQEEEHPPRIVPILLRETTWKMRFGLSGIHAIPRFERWIANIGSGEKFWPNEDAAIRAVAKELGEVVADVEAERTKRRQVEADYRIRVAEMLADDDEISPYERRTLEEERRRLGLPEGVAREVEEREIRRHTAELEKIRAYEADLEFAVRDVGYPFDARTQEELRKRKTKLGLKDEDIEGLDAQVAERVEAERVEAERVEAERVEAEREAQATEASTTVAAAPVIDPGMAPGEGSTPATSTDQVAVAAPDDTSEHEVRSVEPQQPAAVSELGAEQVRESITDDATASWASDLHQLLSDFAELPTILYVAPGIPDRKLTRAFERYGVPVGTPILGMLDETVMGSAKNGLAFGVDTMWFHNAGGSSSPGANSVDYSTFVDADVEKTAPYEVSVSEDLSFNCLRPDETVALLRSVQTLIEERGGLPPARPRVDWSTGQRVFACPGVDPFFYPGTIIDGIDDEDEGVYIVRFDIGPELLVTERGLERDDIREGSRVAARWAGGDTYHPGRIGRRNGESVQVLYDDGDEESTTIDMVRIEWF